MSFKNLLNRLKSKLENSEFSKAITTAGIATIFQILVGILINKIIAVKIGPAGITILGQFTNFRDLMTTAATGSFGQGVTKYVADPEYEEKQVISTSILFTIISSAIISILIVSFADYLSISLLGSEKYKFVFYIFGLTLVFFSLNNILIAIINGKRNYKILLKVKITNSIVALLFSGFLCWFFDLFGALTAIALNNTIVFFISLYILYHLKEIYFNVDKKLWNSLVLKKLLGFTLMALTSTALSPIVQLLIRSHIIDHGSIFEAGIWESMKKFSSYYTQIITMSLSVYYLPKLSSLKTNKQLNSIIIKGLIFIMPIFTIMAFGLFLTKSFLINILFSEEFSSMKDLFFAQLTGDFFMIFSFMISNMLLAKAMIKTFILTQVLMASSRIYFSVIFFDLNGIEGIIWANALNYFLYAILMIIIFRKVLWYNFYEV